MTGRGLAQDMPMLEFNSWPTHDPATPALQDISGRALGYQVKAEDEPTVQRPPTPSALEIFLADPLGEIGSATGKVLASIGQTAGAVVGQTAGAAGAGAAGQLFPDLSGATRALVLLGVGIAALWVVVPAVTRRNPATGRHTPARQERARLLRIRRAFHGPGGSAMARLRRERRGRRGYW